MAPEVIGSSRRFGKGYGLAADWWAFGALAFDMMVGHPPFQVSQKFFIVEERRSDIF